MADHTGPQTVKLNVGGKAFEVSRSLIDRYEDTVLATLVSDTRQTDEAVFIDRSGEIFAQVVEYLRYGSITLPGSIPKDMFLRDLEFYGIDAEEGAVKVEGWAAQVASRHERIECLESEKGGLELENNIDRLAGLCFSNHLRSNMFNQTLTIKKYLVEFGESSEEDDLYETARLASDATANRSMFEESLSKFGLRIVGIRHYPSSRKYPKGNRVEIALGSL
ncbi:hypothetical protein ACHAXT_005659 [Thalassiosira profunda]